MIPWNLLTLDDALRASWAADTCSPDDLARAGWQPNNPAWGHCDVTALVVNDIFGGDLMVGEVHCGGEQHGFHWWNRLPSGVELDLTREQFRDGQTVTAARVVERPPGPLRRWEEYLLLRERVIKHLGRRPDRRPHTSTAAADHLGPLRGEPAHPAGSGSGLPEMHDLLVLGGEPGQDLSAEVRELLDLLLGRGQSLLEFAVLRLQAGDLGFAGVGNLAGLLQGLQPVFELGAEACVGAGAVKGGAVDARFAREGLDVALAAGRDLSAQKPVHGGPDAVFVLGSLGCGDVHADSSFLVLAASISATTRRARP